MSDPAKLVRNLDLIQTALREIGPQIPDECRTPYIEAVSSLAYIQGYCQIPLDRNVLPFTTNTTAPCQNAQKHSL